ncbi:hypothetical protein [Psychroserpens sp. MEBiC05023]
MPNIPCPKCQTKIEFEFNEVINGKSFICNSCKTEITMTYEDNKQTLARAEKKLNILKRDLDIN